MPESQVKEFFRNKNIFLTGGTGFVGLALVEKLLRTTEVNKIYLLIRQKKGKDVAERMEEYKKNAVFERLIKECGTDKFNKIVPIAGDVGEPELGLSNEDKEILIDMVNIVFHSAATLDFEASLRTTVQINLKGTRSVVALAKQMKHIEALLHVSSAYVNSHILTPLEQLYPIHLTGDKVIEIVDKLSDKELQEKNLAILGEYINTYTFTKALAEHEVAASIASFPSVIVRPSMIVASWKEPLPGWTSSKNGPQGFIMGAGKGVVRRLPLDENLVTDYIPVDIVINGMLVGAWHAGVKKPTETPIFHLTSSTTNPFKWRMVTPVMHEVLHDAPLKSAVWYPCLKIVPSLLWYKISALIFHWLPAYILDTVARVTGGRPILVRMHTNINNALELLKPFIFTEWIFDSKRTVALQDSLSPEDKELYSLDIKSLEWVEFFYKLTLGVRTYLHNDPLSTIPKAKKKDQMLRWLNLLIQFVFTGVVWSLFTLTTGTTFRGTLFMVPLVLSIISYL